MDILLSCGNVTLTPGLYNCGVFFFFGTASPCVTPFSPNRLSVPTRPPTPITQFEKGKDSDWVGFFPGLIWSTWQYNFWGFGQGWKENCATSLLHFTIICVFPHLPVFEVYNINLTFFLALWLLIIFPLALIFFSVWFC